MDVYGLQQSMLLTCMKTDHLVPSACMDEVYSLQSLFADIESSQRLCWCVCIGGVIDTSTVTTTPYEIHYTAQDAQGNIAAPVSRSVSVYNPCLPEAYCTASGEPLLLMFCSCTLQVSFACSLCKLLLTAFAEMHEIAMLANQSCALLAIQAHSIIGDYQVYSVYSAISSFHTHQQTVLGEAFVLPHNP